MKAQNIHDLQTRLFVASWIGDIDGQAKAQRAIVRLNKKARRPRSKYKNAKP